MVLLLSPCGAAPRGAPTAVSPDVVIFGQKSQTPSSAHPEQHGLDLPQTLRIPPNTDDRIVVEKRLRQPNDHVGETFRGEDGFECARIDLGADQAFNRRD